jgi:hypothetical protein
LNDQFLDHLKQEFRSAKLMEFALCHMIDDSSAEKLISICTMTATDYPSVFDHCNIKEMKGKHQKLTQTMNNIKDLINILAYKRVFVLRSVKASVLNYHIKKVS